MSCKTKKVLTTEDSNYKMDLPDDLMELKSVCKGKFKTVKIKKTNGSIWINGDYQSFKINVAVYRDSLIGISVIPALGYEVFRFMCTRDSVIAINRHDKKYIASSLNKYCLQNGIPINFEGLQSILLNEVFIYQGNIQDRKYVESITEDNSEKVYNLESFYKDKKLTNQKLGINYENSKPVLNLFDDYGNKFHFTVEYTDFYRDRDFSFPQSMKLIIRDKANRIELILEFGVITFDEPVNMDFAVPSQYHRIE